MSDRPDAYPCASCGTPDALRRGDPGAVVMARDADTGETVTLRLCWDCAPAPGLPHPTQDGPAGEEEG